MTLSCKELVETKPGFNYQTSLHTRLFFFFWTVTIFPSEISSCAVPPGDRKDRRGILTYCVKVTPSYPIRDSLQASRKLKPVDKYHELRGRCAYLGALVCWVRSSQGKVTPRTANLLSLILYYSNELFVPSKLFLRLNQKP